MAGRDIDPDNPVQIDARLQSILRGAFQGSPTPLKEIPKRDGASRSTKKDSHRSIPRKSGNKDQAQK
jgi:hypothetical protein